MSKIDNTCFSCLQSVFLEFRDHSHPIVATSTMLEFIAKAPAIFGDTWDLLCELCGVKPKQKEEKQCNIPHINSVSYKMIAMAWRANRKKLTYRAFIHSMSKYARGVGPSAEKFFAYFWHTLSHPTRMHIMAQLMGSYKQGILNNDTLHHKQSTLLCAQCTLLAAYDNYQ